MTRPIFIHPQGREFLVSFEQDGKRHNLGYFDTRGEAEKALARRLDAISATRRLKESSGPPERVPQRTSETRVANEKLLTVAQLRRLVRYSPESGVMQPAPVVKEGALPTIDLLGVPLYAHRVAWALTNGLWPPCRVVLADRSSANLRYANLRLTVK